MKLAMPCWWMKGAVSKRNLHICTVRTPSDDLLRSLQAPEKASAILAKHWCLHVSVFVCVGHDYGACVVLVAQEAARKHAWACVRVRAARRTLSLFVCGCLC